MPQRQNEKLLAVLVQLWSLEFGRWNLVLSDDEDDEGAEETGGKTQWL